MCDLSPTQIGTVHLPCVFEHAYRHVCMPKKPAHDMTQPMNPLKVLVIYTCMSAAPYRLVWLTLPPLATLTNHRNIWKRSSDTWRGARACVRCRTKSIICQMTVGINGRRHTKNCFGWSACYRTTQPNEYTIYIAHTLLCAIAYGTRWLCYMSHPSYMARKCAYACILDRQASFHRITFANKSLIKIKLIT